MDWLDLLAVQGTPKSLLQHNSSKASILQCSAFFIVQLSHPYLTSGKTKALTRQTFVGKVMSLLFNILSRLVMTFLLMIKRLLISWLQSPSAVILEPKKYLEQKNIVFRSPLFPYFYLLDFINFSSSLISFYTLFTNSFLRYKHVRNCLSISSLFSNLSDSGYPSTLQQVHP